MNQEKSRYQHAEHEFGPVYDQNSRVLILGSFPSVKSREQQFYYGHPQNRFWKMITAVYGEKIPENIQEKKDLLLRNRIALWDVIESCDIIGSSDSSIRNVKLNPIERIVRETEIELICCNGEKSYRLFLRYHQELASAVPVFRMPSTSPANAACTLERLIAEWGELLRNQTGNAGTEALKQER